MTDATSLPDGVHFVGSIALDSVPEVFRVCGTTLGRRLKRMPDGEPGGRRLWLSWQYPLLRASPYLEVNPAQPSVATGFSLLRLADGVKPEEVGFGELGYAREARASYQDFLRARDNGEIATATRLQVALPTKLAVIGAFCPGPICRRLSKPTSGRWSVRLLLSPSVFRTTISAFSGMCVSRW